MKTLMIITPHMSTGGCPQVVAKKVELLKDFYNIVVVEWECIAWSYVVQRNRVINMLGEQFVSLSENKEYDLFNLIDDYQPEYIFIEELSETFIPLSILVLDNKTDKINKIEVIKKDSSLSIKTEIFLENYYSVVIYINTDLIKIY